MDYINIPDNRTSKPLNLHRLSFLIRVYKSYILIFSTIFLYIFYHFYVNKNPSSSRNKSQENDKKPEQNDIENQFSKESLFESKIPSHSNMRIYQSNLFKQNSIPMDSSLRSKLSFYFPYKSQSPLPKNIFQTWKTGPDDPTFSKKFLSSYKSWKNLNTNFTYSLITDEIIDEWVENEFYQIPEIIHAWKLLPKKILKADFFRYLVVFARGGVYSDMDTLCLKKIDTWAPFNEKLLLKSIKSGLTDVGDSNRAEDLIQNKIDSINLETPVGMVIGIEADPDRSDWSDWYARRIQFVQWTVMGKKGHPLLRELIIRITNETNRKSAKGYLSKVEGKDEGGDIMQWTGPGIFTDMVFDYLNNVATNGKSGEGFGVGSDYWLEGEKFLLKSQEIDENGMPLNASKMKINWQTFTGLVEPLLIDDVLILPITSFSPGVGQMGSKSVKHDLAYVNHLFEGSWKPEKERMKD